MASLRRVPLRLCAVQAVGFGERPAGEWQVGIQLLRALQKIQSPFAVVQTRPEQRVVRLGPQQLGRLTAAGLAFFQLRSSGLERAFRHRQLGGGRPHPRIPVVHGASGFHVARCSDRIPAQGGQARLQQGSLQAQLGVVPQFLEQLLCHIRPSIREGFAQGHHPGVVPTHPRRAPFGGARSLPRRAGPGGRIGTTSAHPKHAPQQHERGAGNGTLTAGSRRPRPCGNRGKALG